jgi:hypothetical protein
MSRGSPSCAAYNCINILMRSASTNCDGSTYEDVIDDWHFLMRISKKKKNNNWRNDVSSSCTVKT